MAASLKLVEDKKVDADRQKALDAALAQIDRAFGKGSAMKLGQKETMQVEAISTGSLGLDIALGVGGLPKGRVIEVYGPESSGKTTLALHVLAEAQKAGGTVAFVDAGGRVCAQHCLLQPVQASAMDREIQQPVFLDGTAREQFSAGNIDFFSARFRLQPFSNRAARFCIHTQALPQFDASIPAHS